MYRHIFMAEFKDDVSEDIRRKEIEDMKRMKEKIPEIVELEVSRTTGWVGKRI